MNLSDPAAAIQMDSPVRPACGLLETVAVSRFPRRSCQFPESAALARCHPIDSEANPPILGSANLMGLRAQVRPSAIGQPSEHPCDLLTKEA